MIKDLIILIHLINILESKTTVRVHLNNLCPLLWEMFNISYMYIYMHKTKEETIKEFVRQQGSIALDWHVPDFYNTRVGDLITKRIPIETTTGKILFNCPPLSEYFHTSTFGLDPTTGWVYTYLLPPGDIGVPCQQEPFDLELLTEKLQNDFDTSEL